MTMYYQKPVNQKETLICGETYHIYNRAVGNELLFRTDEDYSYFLKKLERFVLPFIDIYAYCLIPNHFHLLLRTKESNKITELQNVDEEEYSAYLSHVFGRFFNSYSKSFNKVYGRKGRLFIQPFKRITVEDEEYLTILVNYIHRNPIHHGLVKDFSDWKYSSYNAIISNKPTNISKQKVISYFDSIEDFIEFHLENKSKTGIEKFYFE